MTKAERFDRLPVDPATGSPIAPRPQPGYYPGYSTLAQSGFWDDETRKVVLGRLEPPPPLRFFTPEEATLMQAVLDRVLPQDDRLPEFRIPILPSLDARLHHGQGPGYRYEKMPPDGEAHRLGLQAIDAIAHHLFHQGFVALGPLEQDQILESIHHAKPEAGHEVWAKMPVERFWLLLVQDAVDAYYAHPWAWDEIGFGGPAYPRGYMRLENGQPEPWEGKEARYPWEAPPKSLSGKYEPVGGHHDHHGAPGQGGSH